MCVPISRRGKPGIEASCQPGGSGHPSAAPTPCCLPGCSHLCTTMSGIFLSAQLGGRWCVGLCALPAPGPQPEASPPSSPHARLPAHPAGRAGREELGPGCPIPWEGPALGSQTGTHTQQGLDIGSPGPTRQHSHSWWVAGLGTPPEFSGASKGTGQCPTVHGWAPIAPPDIQIYAYMSHLCTHRT